MSEHSPDQSHRQRSGSKDWETSQASKPPEVKSGVSKVRGDEPVAELAVFLATLRGDKPQEIPTRNGDVVGGSPRCSSPRTSQDFDVSTPNHDSLLASAQVILSRALRQRKKLQMIQLNRMEVWTVFGALRRSVLVRNEFATVPNDALRISLAGRES